MFNRELYPVLESDRHPPRIAFTPYAVFLDAAVSFSDRQLEAGRKEKNPSRTN